MSCPTIAERINHSLVASIILLISYCQEHRKTRSALRELMNLHSMKRDPSEKDPQQLDKVRKTLRGRAEKACVRCRAKKRTCDGGQPCQRCKESHSACYFSDWHYTVPYPREYVEYLEEQQEQLSSGLMTMYRLLKESNITTIPPLPEKPQAQDLVAALRGLRLDKTKHPAGHPHVQTNGSTLNFTNGTTQPPESRPLHDHMMQHNCFEAASRSPTQPSMYMPPFPSMSMPGSTNGPGPPPSIPTSVPGSFVPLTYAPFDYTREAHASSQDYQSFSPIHATTPVFGQLPANGISSISDTWNGSHEPSLSPAIGLHMSPQTTAGRSPRSLTDDSGHERHNNERIPNHHHQHRWSSWPGQTDIGLGFYGNGNMNMGGGGPHDASLGLGLESIEQRGGDHAPA